MRKLSIILLVLTMTVGSSQENINKYKYIIVPKKFEAFKKENQYKTSTLVKFLFSKAGFNAVYEDALPQDLSSDRCLGLTIGINDRSSLFTTKTSMVLRDCSSNIVLTTITGNSKEKDYDTAYKEALTKAFETIRALDYEYASSNWTKETVSLGSKNDAKEMKRNKEPKNKVDAKVTEQVATAEKQIFRNKEPIESNIKKAKPSKVKAEDDSTAKAASKVLYAQEIPNGYQLVDSTPKIQIRIFKSSLPDFYLAKTDDKNGVVYKKADKWYFEYYLEDALKTEELHIKF